MKKNAMLLSTWAKVAPKCINLLAPGILWEKNAMLL